MGEKDLTALSTSKLIRVSIGELFCATGEDDGGAELGGKTTGTSGMAFGTMFLVATLLRCSSSSLHRVVRISTESARSFFSVATLASSSLQASRSTLKFSFSNSSGVRARVCLTFFCCLILEEVTGGKLGADKSDTGGDVVHDEELRSDSKETVTVGEVVVIVREVRECGMVMGTKGSAFLFRWDRVTARDVSIEDETSADDALISVGKGNSGGLERTVSSAETLDAGTEIDGKAMTGTGDVPREADGGRWESRARVFWGGQSSDS